MTLTPEREAEIRAKVANHGDRAVLWGTCEVWIGELLAELSRLRAERDEAMRYQRVVFSEMAKMVPLSDEPRCTGTLELAREITARATAAEAALAAEREAREKAERFHESAEEDLKRWIVRCNERDKDVSDLRADYLELEARERKLLELLADCLGELQKDSSGLRLRLRINAALAEGSA